MKLASAVVSAGRPMLYYPILANVLGGVGPAVLFCGLVWRDMDFDHKRTTERLIVVRKSIAALTAETGLTDKELRGARKKLAGLGVVASRYRRMAHELEFELDLNRADSLCEALEASAKRADAGIGQKGGCLPGASAKRADEHLPKGPIDHSLEKVKNEKEERERPFLPLEGEKAKVAWQDVLGVLREGINPQSYTTWLAPSRGLAVRDGILQVGVPSFEFAEWIAEHWAQEICMAVGGLGVPFQVVEFVVREKGMVAIKRRLVLNPMPPAPWEMAVGHEAQL